jgi:hypothetical protein
MKFKQLIHKKIMKKLFTFLLILIGLMAHAQDNKPTKEETIEYINNFLAENEEETLLWKGYFYKDRKAVIREYNGSLILYSEFLRTQQFYGGGEKKYFVINLSNVEAITVESDSAIQGVAQVGLRFVEKGKPTKDKIHIPLWLTIADYNPNSAFRTSQIYKAFQHLRKLCGAPEPLKF